MKTLLGHVSLFLVLSACLLGQDLPKHLAPKNEPSCKPIFYNTHGPTTINCYGFSREEVQKIERLLHGIASAEAKNRDTILQRIDDDALKIISNLKIGQQRKITDEQLQRMRNNYNGGAGGTLIITTQSGDDESSVFASQLQSVFGGLGFLVPPVRYESKLPPSPDVNADVVLMATTGTQSGAEFVWASFQTTTFEYKLIQVDLSKTDWDTHTPMKMFVYPLKDRSAEAQIHP